MVDDTVPPSFVSSRDMKKEHFCEVSNLYLDWNSHRHWILIDFRIFAWLRKMLRWGDLILWYHYEILDSTPFFIILEGYRGTSTIIFDHVTPITPWKKTNGSELIFLQKSLDNCNFVACWWRDLILRYQHEILDSSSFFMFIKGYRGIPTVIFHHVTPITPGKSGIDQN